MQSYNPSILLKNLISILDINKFTIDTNYMINSFEVASTIIQQ